MTLTLRPAAQRGHANHGWLDSYHSFSFADYYDPAQMGFRTLRVINDDLISPGAGFPTHGHKDMEIITYVIEGKLGHKDTMGNEGVLARGDVQSMSAGTGIRHSEYNLSDAEKLRLIQIWIPPRKPHLTPFYGQTHFPDREKKNKLRLLVSPDQAEGALPIQQDAQIYASVLAAGFSVTHKLAKGRAAWLQIVDGELDADGQSLQRGDGAAIENTDTLTLTARTDSEFLLFDLA